MALMILGSIVLCLGVFGCTGLPMRHKPTAVVFYITMNILIFLEIGIGIYWAIMWSNYGKYLGPSFQLAFDQYKSEPEPWKFLHQAHNCCGINGPQDFQTNYTQIPPECCHYSQKLDNNTPRTPSYCPLNNAAKEGCQPTLLNLLKSDAYILIFTAVICGILKWLFLLAAFVINFPDSPPSQFKVSGAGSAYYFVDRNDR